VGGLLGSLGLGKYKGLFAREEVDLEALSCKIGRASCRERVFATV
jgi:hypothetical protein